MPSPSSFSPPAPPPQTPVPSLSDLQSFPPQSSSSLRPQPLPLQTSRPPPSDPGVLTDAQSCFPSGGRSLTPSVRAMH